MALDKLYEDKADEKLSAILHYRISNISSKSARNFMEEVAARVATLTEYPESGRPSKQNTKEVPLRYITVAGSHRLYYTFDDSTIRVLDFISAKAGNNPYEQ